MSLATRESGRLAREISSFPNVSRETSFFGNDQLVKKDWNDSELSTIFSSSGGRSNGQGRNAAIRDKIYEQDEKIEHLTRALKEKKKDKRKRKEREKKIEEARSILESTTSTFKVEEVKEKEECVNPFDIFPFAKEFQEKHPELIIEFAPPPEVPSFLAEDNVICFNPWCKDHTKVEEEEKREDPLTLHSLAKKMEALNNENKELHERFYKLEVSLCNLNDRIQQLESSSLAKLVD